MIIFSEMIKLMSPCAIIFQRGAALAWRALAHWLWERYESRRATYYGPRTGTRRTLGESHGLQ
jgi:hypothetical protein